MNFFALREMLQQLIELMRPRAEQKGLKLDLQLDAELPTHVMGDRKRFEQVLLNLLSNAVKFTSSGSVTLSAMRDAQEAGLWRFEVRDTGIGIVASKLESIFEPFTQADPSTTRQYGGTGLGLAITRSIAKLMGGRIAVESKPGVGSCFSVIVPLHACAPPAEADLQSADKGAVLPASGPRLLLAEDNEVNVYLFEAMLQDSGAQIDTAANGLTALEMAQRRRYDLIFMDVQMPGLDGLTVTRRLREFEAAQGRSRTPVVALTANAFASDVQASVAAGCDAHLSKPYSKQQLAELLARWAVPNANPPSDESQVFGTGLTREAVPPLLQLDQTADPGKRAHAAIFLPQWLQDFNVAHRNGQRERVRALAHDLADVAEGIAAPDLAATARELESSVMDATPSDADAMHERLLKALGPAVMALTDHEGG